MKALHLMLCAVAVLSACTGDSALLGSALPIYSTRLVNASDADGLGSVTAICLTSTVAGTLKQGLSPPDPEVALLVEQFAPHVKRTAHPDPRRHGPG